MFFDITEGIISLANERYHQSCFAIAHPRVAKYFTLRLLNISQANGSTNLSKDLLTVVFYHDNLV